MSGAPETIRVVVIRGRDQRVGFRAFVEYTAGERGVAGWVRNRRDGSVEALFAGDSLAVDGMIEACRRGPSSARVDGIEWRAATADDLALRQSGNRFLQLPTV